MQETKMFGSLEISKRVYSAISDMGFEEPSPIQTAAIPVLMKGSDLIGQAQTGTGKTAAFGIPIIEQVNTRQRGVQALILTPTRELAIQVAEEMSKIGKYRDTRIVAIYGGQSIDRQIMALRRGVQVAVGTPGRILDHINRGTLVLKDVRFLVLDEADEMLDMGFVDDIERIIKETPSERQTLLFSATMPLEIQRLSRKYLRDPELISVSKDELTVPQIEQVFYEVKMHNKVEALCRVLDVSEIKLAIIFCRTKRGVDELVAGLETRGYGAEGLHGDLTQAQRNKVMKKFRESKVEILVATDVAARGLDIENVSHVINFDLPQDPESYVHRIGRTGRAGRTGIAISFVIPPEYRLLRMIERVANTRIVRNQLPSVQDVFDRQRGQIIKQLVTNVEKGGLDQYLEIVREMNGQFDSMDIAAAALKIAFDLEVSEEEVIEVKSSFNLDNTGARPGLVRLFINLGRMEQLRPGDLTNLIAEGAGISSKTIGSIKIFDKFTFVEVPREDAEKVIYSLNRTNYKGKRLFIEPAKMRRN